MPLKLLSCFFTFRWAKLCLVTLSVGSLASFREDESTVCFVCCSNAHWTICLFERRSADQGRSLGHSRMSWALHFVPQQWAGRYMTIAQKQGILDWMRLLDLGCWSAFQLWLSDPDLQRKFCYCHQNLDSQCDPVFSAKNSDLSNLQLTWTTFDHAFWSAKKFWYFLHPSVVLRQILAYFKYFWSESF